MAAASAGGVATIAPRRRARLGGAGREPGVDLARGLAVFGMFAAHVVVTATSFDAGDPASWNAVVNGNSSILFATLAGLSLALVSGGAAPLTGMALGTARARIAVRAVCIFLVGLALMALGTPVYVILPAYGILFLLALPLLGLPVWALAALAGAVAVVGPFAVAAIDAWPIWSGPEGAALADALGWHYPFVAWIAFVAAGMALGRADLSRLSTAAAALCIGSGAAILGFGLVPRLLPLSPAFDGAPHSTGMGEMIGSGGLAIAIVGACVLVCRTPVRVLVWPLRAVGSMPLSAYAAQLVVWAVWIAATGGGDLGALAGFRAAEPFWPLSLATLAACSAWAALVGKGPLEAGIAWVARTVVPGAMPRGDRLGA
ncbi:heparan-alpha-glucosaminide N-acetyltransferase domain-containing protein [Microbacterium sp. ZXX196]|uniref:heparan-alpha-glucosaminide N-acetyltransferase domain-containing protein n=1 Tax=Microbacterium sp. ZXX196 TaxID=2609291 RepID=UPI0034D169D4